MGHSSSQRRPGRGASGRGPEASPTRRPRAAGSGARSRKAKRTRGHQRDWRRRGSDAPRRPPQSRCPPRPGRVREPSDMEPWKQCAQWLIHSKVSPPNHRVTWDSAQVFDSAQTLRDGVSLCQSLNNSRPHSINSKEINSRPQMSQFLCLKNIRTFSAACCDTFGMRKSELFEAFDLFDVRDFGKDWLSQMYPGIQCCFNAR